MADTTALALTTSDDEEAVAFGNQVRGLFDLVMGLNRWVYRVAAYVLLLTDEYPPFRLDQGGDEPSALVGALEDD